MNIVSQLGLVVVLTAVVLAAFYYLRKYVMVKYTFKKRHLIPLLAVIILTPVLLVLINPKLLLPSWAYTLQMVLFSVVFLMYVEVLKRDRLNLKLKKMNPSGKPKPKPNRIKNKM